MAEKSRVQQGRGVASIKAGVRPAEGNSQGRKYVGRDETGARAGSSERPFCAGRGSDLILWVLQVMEGTEQRNEKMQTSF